MSRLTQFAKAVVLADPKVAETVYKGLTLWRARRAARAGGPFGQSAEDAWFLGWLRKSRIPWAEAGFYIDIGANHPVVLSATYLLYKTGWRGLAVEPIPSLCALHRRMRPRDTQLNVGAGSSSETRPFWETAPDYFSSFSRDTAVAAEADGLCRILRQARLSVVTPRDILARVPAGLRVNYLSIDTEGLDGEILSAWPWEECRPDIVSCEASAVEESQAGRRLAAEGYSMVRKFPVTAFWRSPELAGTFAMPS